VRISLFGQLRVEHEGAELALSGSMQLAVFFRLAVDAGRSVSVREIVEDVWGLDAPENEKAALQSVISRLRSQLPSGTIESTPGGYRLHVARADVDALAFTDLVESDPAAALALWTGEPWIPSDSFDWFVRDLRRDHAAALAATAARPAARSTIPLPLTALVGRQAELAAIAQQLATSRLVTIIGTGGAGKTRLAIESALRVPSAILVELAPVGAGEVLGAVLTASGREIRKAELPAEVGIRERLIDQLAGRDLLLVLDNCEHVVSEAALVAQDLLTTLPGLRILATSREPLAIAGEAFVAAGPLDADTGLALLAERAVAARGAGLSDAELLDAAAVVARLDGLPLALELAAARLRTLSMAEVLAGLEHRFSLLAGSFRTALPRHQTLRAMIDWSWSLLGPEERHALTQLAVFPAGVDARDMASLADRMGLRSASAFDSLVDKSLLQRSRGRYRALETIREYGLERLAEESRTQQARAVQARHETDRAVEMDRLLRGPRIREAIEWFDAEEDNISAALRFVTGERLAEVAVALLTSCAWYWIVRGRQEDASTWFPVISPLAEGVAGAEAQLIALIEPVATAMGGSSDEGDVDPSGFLTEGLGLLAPIAEMTIAAGSHELLQLVPPVIGAFGDVAARPDWMTAVRLPDGESPTLDAWPRAVLRVMRAAMAQNRGDIDELGAESEIAVASFEQQGDLWGLALSKQMRAEWLALDGQLEEALRMCDESTESLRSITPSYDLAQQQGQAVAVLLRLNRVDDARERADALVVEATDSGNSRALVQALVTSVVVDLELRDLTAADARLATVTELLTTWPGRPSQLHAMAECALAGADVLRGDLDAAETHLRAAAAAAFASHDQPVIGHVAISIGSLALARGDVALALRAVDLATVVIGAYDRTHPQVVAIEKAAAAAGIGRTSAAALARPDALRALAELAG
jgi:predicted ATPase